MKQNNFQAIMNFGIVEIITNYGEMPNSAEILNLLQIEQAKLTAQKNYMILGGDLKLAGDCCALKDVKEQEPHQSKWRNMKLAKKSMNVQRGLLLNSQTEKNVSRQSWIWSFWRRKCMTG